MIEFEVSIFIYSYNNWLIFLVIECLSVGENFVAVFTSLRYLRIFTANGTQRLVVSTPGILLTISYYFKNDIISVFV